MSPIFPPFRLGLAVVVLLACIDDAAALGLGELRSRSYLGERFLAEVDVLTAGREVVDAGCFGLKAPLGGGELPWLKRGSFNVRRGSPMVLEIHSEQALRDPVLQVGIVVGCGHEMQRDYTLLLSPRGSGPVPARPEIATPVVPAVTQRRVAPMPVPAEAEPAVPRKVPIRRAEKRAKPTSEADRLVLSGDRSAGRDASLRLATGLSNWQETTAATREAQRELLRLEYRMLAVLAEQATSQLAAADKLRNMEETLAALRSRTDELAGRIEKGASGADAPALVEPPATVGPAAVLPGEKSSLLSEWSFYGALLGALLGIGGWLGWQQYRQRQESRLEPVYAGLEPVAEPVLEEAAKPAAEVDLDVGARDPEVRRRVDMPLEFLERPDTDITVVEGEGGLQAAAAEEVAEGHPEANPVMELAEIMLSFGRVKGAAQALQEYIDNNPQEALQPWIRLMDVYRMAGMREDFERLARDLNRHFNVEIQHWERSGNEPLLERFDLVLVAEDEDLPASQGQLKKALTIEDIGHIRQKLVEIWGMAECREYLDRLLRDNRGGQRSGFTLPVVEEILFLMELHETRYSLDKQTMDGEKND